MPIIGKALLKEALKNGWELDRQKGSHAIVKKSGFRSVSIPMHGNQDLKKGLEKAIRKQLEIVEE